MPEFKPLKQCRRELRMLKVYAYQPIKYLNTLVFMTVNKFFSAIMGLHIFSEKLHRKLEKDTLAKSRCRNYGHRMQEICQRNKRQEKNVNLAFCILHSSSSDYHVSFLALDKEMRSWEAFLALEKTVKNTLTSLKAVSELQNPAIRERHWHQLMTSTKVSSNFEPRNFHFALI